MIRRIGMTILLLGLLLAFLAFMNGCGQSEDVAAPPAKDDNTFDGAGVGRDETLEVVTWNLENFAKSGTVTVGYVVEAVEAMDADVVALQEIRSSTWFDQLVEGLDGWKGHRATSDNYMNLGYLYREDEALEVGSFYEILRWDEAFPRIPLVFQGRFAGEDFIIVNNHFKCCGDGYIDEDDWWDEEYRRQRACVALEGHIAANWSEERVFVIGDFNDSLTDAPSRNVFQVFLDKPDTYRFVDMGVAEGPGTGWSFPGYPSHLDHILINDPVFSAADGADALVQVVPLHTYFPRGLSEYDAYISDHLPVVLRVDLAK